MIDEPGRQPLASSDKARELDAELQAKNEEPLTHEKRMDIARAVMRKNRRVLAAFAAE